MDQTAFTLCQENSIPIIVFNMSDETGLIRAAMGQSVGTSIRN
jgi:uridylate kinase